MYCYKPTNNTYYFTFHLIETIIDDDIKCLCGKTFKKSEVTITKNSPVRKDRDMMECGKCGNNLEKFWRKNVKIFSKVEGTTLHRIGDTDNMVHIKRGKNATTITETTKL